MMKFQNNSYHIEKLDCKKYGQLLGVWLFFRYIISNSINYFLTNYVFDLN